MPETEKMYYEKGYKLVAGVDEVGRGPLAGPVCAAAVILPEGLVLDGVDDSKKITEKKRELLFDVITENAVAWATAFVEPEIIDEINIRNATHLAMQRAVNALDEKADFLLVDGNDKIPFEDVECEYIVKGDSKFMCIAAASIVAKVVRDRYMREMDKEYPGYGFAKNKGYGTQEHMVAIRTQGMTPLHRRSFMTDKVLGRE